MIKGIVLDAKRVGAFLNKLEVKTSYTGTEYIKNWQVSVDMFHLMNSSTSGLVNSAGDRRQKRSINSRKLTVIIDIKLMVFYHKCKGVNQIG